MGPYAPYISFEDKTKMNTADEFIELARKAAEDAAQAEKVDPTGFAPPTTEPLKLDFRVGDYKIHLEVTHLK